jgi:hypothetical protein
MSRKSFLPLIEHYGYRWLRAADGFYYGPIYPSDDDQLVRLRREGKIGHSSVRRGEYQYSLRVPEADDAC